MNFFISHKAVDGWASLYFAFGLFNTGTDILIL